MIQKRKRCVLILGRAVVTQNLFGTQKYLGTIFDNKLCWIENVNSNIKKANARLHYLRKLRSLGVSASLLASVQYSYLWRGLLGRECFLTRKGMMR